MMPQLVARSNRQCGDSLRYPASPQRFSERYTINPCCGVALNQASLTEAKKAFNSSAVRCGISSGKK
jgi:hypothetical protein